MVETAFLSGYKFSAWAVICEFESLWNLLYSQKFTFLSHVLLHCTTRNQHFKVVLFVLWKTENK